MIEALRDAPAPRLRRLRALLFRQAGHDCLRIAFGCAELILEIAYVGGELVRRCHDPRVSRH
jgi:hypothetical protein